MPSVTNAARRAPRRDAAENREALLAAAATELAADPEASLAAIAEAAGLTRRAVYGHFANRDDLVLALIARGAERVNQVAASVDHPQAPVAIALLGARLWGAVEHIRVLVGIALSTPYIDGAASALAPVRERLLGFVDRGAADGSVRSDIRPVLLARFIESAVVAVLRESIDPRFDPADGPRLVMLASLGAAGLGWRESGELIASVPELAEHREPRA